MKTAIKTLGFIGLTILLVFVLTKNKEIRQYKINEQKQLEFLLETNIGFSIIMCRIHYRRVPKPLPYTLEDQAVYWKAYYNSHLGKGTVEKFIEICK